MADLSGFFDLFLGRAIRAFPPEDNKIYLTFDDGPDEKTTPDVLDMLSKHSAKATFFLVAERARRSPRLVRRIVEDGHAIGNHSLDHRYVHFFANAGRLKPWIQSAGEILKDVAAIEPVGFRPPAGIRTPPLAKTLAELGEPLVLWSTRYYDGVRPWTQKAAEASLKTLSRRNIVLLHDRRKENQAPGFLVTLEWFLNATHRSGHRLARIERRQCLELMPLTRSGIAAKREIVWQQSETGKGG